MASDQSESGSRTAVVTGGTGALGREVVGVFLGKGHRVVVPWIVKTESEALAARFRTETEAARLEFLEADVADERSAAEVARVDGAASLLVNAVGGFGGGTPVDETELALWDQMYRINVRSAVAMSCLGCARAGTA